MNEVLSIATGSNAVTHRYDTKGRLVYCSHARPWVNEAGAQSEFGYVAECPHVDEWDTEILRMPQPWDRVVIWRTGDPGEWHTDGGL